VPAPETEENKPMSTLALRTRPAWDLDRWVRDFFGPVTADDWFAGSFTPAAEIVKDGDDAVVRVELPAHVTGEAISASYDKGVLTVRVAGAHKGAEAQRIAIENK
jgi:HSP20 family protein